MLFSSHVFIFLFLPLTLLGYFLWGKLSRRAARIFLVGACLFFYGWFNPAYLPVIMTSMAVNYGCAAILGRLRAGRARNLTFTLGALFNLGFLGYFKYYDFMAGTVNALFAQNWTLLHLLLPLGISFFTFQQISYLFDVYRGELKENYSILDYMLFVAFFPQLIAGPIVLPEEMMSQFAAPDSHIPRARHIAGGLWLFAIGLAKKVLLADSFALLCDEGFAAASLNGPEAWCSALSYTLQIYFDFSGYCDMALGIGWMFNIKLPLNFNSPYRSANIREFWQRWHITLGRFLSMFVYFPLGGSKKSNARTILNLMLTFLISGLWHGAGWLFVLWGGLHGLAMAGQRVWSVHLKRSMPRIAGCALTFIFLLFSWVLFRAESMEQAGKVYRGMFSPDWSGFGEIFFGNSGIMLLIALAIIFIFGNAASKLDDFKCSRGSAAVTILLLLSSVFMLNRYSPFIYFNF